jgi:hypothetical protein
MWVEVALPLASKLSETIHLGAAASASRSHYPHSKRR